MVIVEQSSATVDTCQMNIKIDTDKPVTLSINTTNEHHHLHTTSTPSSVYHSRNAPPPQPPSSAGMNGNSVNPGHFHHHHTHLYNPSSAYGYAPAPPQMPPPSSTSYYSMQPNNLYADPYSQCSSYWKAAAAAASSSDLSKIPPHHANRLPYPMDHPHSSSNMHYMPSSNGGGGGGGSSSHLDIKSEHSSPMKNSQVPISGGDDSNESHPTVTEDDNEDEDDDGDEEMDLKSSGKDELTNAQTNTPRKSNRRAEKPPCQYPSLVDLSISSFTFRFLHCSDRHGDQ